MKVLEHTEMDVRMFCRIIKIVMICWILIPCGAFAQARDPVDYVNPFIGTEKSSHFTMWAADGATFPGVLLPYGMVQITPNGYTYADKKIRSFSFLNHSSGWSSYGSFNLMAFAGDPGRKEQDLASAFSHGEEKATPYYYRVMLQDDGINAEFTATARVGLCKFTFPRDRSAHFVLSDVSDLERVDSNRINGRCGNYYFTAVFSKAPGPVNPYPQESGAAAYSGMGKGTAYLISFPAGSGEIILVKIGFSTRSYTGVETNMEKELPGWDFGQACLVSKRIWNEKLGRIAVVSSNDTLKEIFYTALYHSLFMPVVVSDADALRDQYTPLYPWDTYRSEHPLITILDPKREGDMIHSVLERYDRTGWLPTGNMMGNHNTQLILDSYLKGVTNFDVNKAAAAMCKSLVDSPYARRQMADFVKYGFVPANITSSVTHSLEFAYDSWAAARFLEKTGNEKNYRKQYEALTRRALYYINSYDPVSGFMKARTASGQWTDGGYAEGTPWTYSWYVPHDVQGLINLMGGRTAFSKKLNRCFEEGHYVHDNEPPLHYAYLFDFSGQPWLTQRWSREIVEGSYSTDPGGLPGNDDLGAMSSWFVLSAMGFYPVTPGTTQYEIGSPVFKETIIHLSNGKQFVIKANHVSKKNKYIQSASIDGIPLNKPWFSHEDIVSGKTLVLEMGPQPNKKWGTGNGTLPYSMTEGTAKFTFSKMALSVKTQKANETADLSVNVKNNSKVAGSINFPVQIDGRLFQTVSAVLNPGESRTLHIPITLYEQGTHVLSIPGIGIRKLEIQRTVPTFIYSDLEVPSPPLVKLSDSIQIGVKVKNAGSYPDAATVNLFINGKVQQSEKTLLKPGQEKEVRFVYIPGREGLYHIGAGDLKAVFMRVLGPSEKRVYHDSLFSALNALLVMDFDEGPSAEIKDFSGQGNNGIVMGNLKWVQGMFGKAVQTDASQGDYIRFPDSGSLAKTSQGTSLTMMAWIYPIDEQNFSDIISKGDWNCLQLKGSNHLIDFYTGGWEGHEAIASVPENWNRHWHHLAGVADGTDYRLYVDGKLAVIKKGELRDPHGETGTTDYSGSPWNIGRNASSPDRVFKGYIDDVMIFKKALNQQQVMSLMLHIY